MLKNFMLNWLGLKKLPQWLLQESEAESWVMPDPQVYANQASLYRQSQTLGTVIDAIVNACIAADMDVLDGEGYENDTHPFMLLMENPNEFDSRTEFLRAHFAWRLITGNSYWWLNKPNEYATPDEVWILMPSKILPVPDGKMGVRGYVYYPGNGAEIPLEKWEVVHFKSYNPFNRYLGLSMMESVATIVNGSLAADAWNTKLFAENNARLPGILAFKNQISDPDWEKMKREVTSAATKRTNIMLRGVGDSVNWIQSTATQKDMEFLAGIDANAKRIYDRFAPGFYNMMTSNASLANGETGLYSFQKFTVQPILRETADGINKAIMPLYDDRHHVDYEDVLPEDKTQELAEIEMFARFHPIDEVRQEKYGNYPDPDPERGKLLVAQIGSLSVKSAEPQEAKPAEVVTSEQPARMELPTDEENAIAEEMVKWREFARKPRKREFDTKVIPPALALKIRAGLREGGDVDEVFDNAVKRMNETSEIVRLARSIDAATKVAHE